MKSRFDFKPIAERGLIEITSADSPGDRFVYNIPESIGSTEASIWCASPQIAVKPEWKPTDDGGYRYEWQREGLLGYSVHVSPRDDRIDVRIRLKNLSRKPWPNSQAFSCFQPRQALNFSDFDGTRTFLLIDGKWVPITQVERKDSSRPTIQLYYIRNKPRPLPFVEAFKATPPVYPEAVLAVRSYDGKSFVAVTADKPLYLFQNLEFSCIHCCPTFGALGPNEQGTATHYVLIERDKSLESLIPRLERLWK